MARTAKAKTTKTSKTTKSKAKTTRARRAKTVDAIKPLRKKFTKNELMAKIAEKNELEPRQVKAVMATFERAMMASVMPGGAGEFSWPGMFKVVTKKMPAKKFPAIKKGTEVRNPSTGEMMKSKGRPAYTRPSYIKARIRVLAKLKRASNGDC
jgi:nucleoid DNA-binding protein